MKVISFPPLTKTTTNQQTMMIRRLRLLRTSGVACVNLDMLKVISIGFITESYYVTHNLSVKI